MDTLESSAFFLALALTLISAPVAEADQAGTQVVHLGNEGFLIAGGGKKVLIDALHGDGLNGYVALPAADRERLEAAGAPYDGVDLVLATHRHDDHFSPSSLGRYLEAQPRAVFVSTPKPIRSAWKSRESPCASSRCTTDAAATSPTWGSSSTWAG